MDQELDHRPTQNDPTRAFVALRGEVSLLRLGIEGMAAERQNAPDCNPTLAELAARLTRIEGVIRKVLEAPAMNLTPETVAKSIAKGSEAVRAGDRDIINKAGATLNAAIASISGVVDQALTADRQHKFLVAMSVGGFFAGAIGTFLAAHFIH